MDGPCGVRGAGKWAVCLPTDLIVTVLTGGTAQVARVNMLRDEQVASESVADS